MSFGIRYLCCISSFLSFCARSARLSIRLRSVVYVHVKKYFGTATRLISLEEPHSGLHDVAQATFDVALHQGSSADELQPGIQPTGHCVVGIADHTIPNVSSV